VLLAFPDVIALDTNVLVRYIVRDDEQQTARATALIESECTADAPGLVTLVVLCELVWVLQRGYGYTRPAIVGLLRKILSSQELRSENPELAWQAVNELERGKADFADYVIGLCGKAEKATSTCTFDRRTAGCELFRLL
jgi:predicted nucleic-acid-binding protein